MLIVAATDFSKGASLAVERAARLAGERNARLLLAHVLNEAVWASVKSAFGRGRGKPVDPGDIASEMLASQVQGLVRRLGHRVDGILLRGTASDALAEFVSAQRADLLTMGAHGEKWLRYMLIGGTALKVLRRSVCPVLVVRRSPRRAYEKTIVAVDLSDKAIQVAKAAFALLPDSEHHLVHAFNVPFEGRMRLAGSTEREIDRLRLLARREAKRGLDGLAVRVGGKTGVRIPRELTCGHPISVIMEMQAYLRPDLTVIGRHSGPAGTERLLGSTTQNVLYNSPGDVLVVP